MLGLRSTAAALAAVGLTLAALVVGSSAEAVAPASVTLIVGAPTSLTPGDAAVRSRLQGAGYTVTVADDDTVTAAGAGATTFTIVTTSVTDTVLGSRLAALATPMWVAKPYLFDNYGLAGPVGEVDYGSRVGTTVSVVAPGHPLAAGRSGTITIQGAGNRVSWARAPASATVVARSGSDATIFTIAAGMPLAGGQQAPGCRMSFPIFGNAPTTFTADGWAMFDAAAAWAAAGCASGSVDAPPAVTITSPASGATVRGTIGVTATATDDVGVSSVGFAVDGAAIGLDQNGADGWSASWNTTAAADGSHVVSATATDSTGKTATTSVSVTVANSSAAERPNLLLVNIDDARFDAWQYLPKTTAWMASGVTFANTRAAIPSCCPSRASLFTGRYPHNDGVTVQSGGTNLTGQPTMMGYLKSAGYQTAMAGKFLISWPRTSPPPAFDRHTVIWGGYYNYSAAVDGASRTVSEYSTIFLAKQLRGYLHGFESSDATPWLGYLAPQAPHVVGGWKTLAVPETKYAAAAVGPCAKPGEPDRSDKPPYVSWVAPDPAYDQALCESQIRTLMTVDDEIDLTMRQLQADGELSNTIVMVTSDNGLFWGEHDWKDKFLPYEPSVRIPLKVRWDGHLTARTDPRLASVVDILPTMLETIGSTPSAVIDGRSLFRTDNLRSDVYSEYFNDPDNGSTVPTWASLTNTARKYIESSIVNSSGQTTTFKEYYNLVNDPGELVNLLRDGNPANDPSAAELTSLTQRLASSRTCKGEVCP